MEQLLSLFLLLVAALVAILTYLFVPRMPVSSLMLFSAVALAVGVWWHWSQFSVDYRTSTWQQTLRDYASYVIVFLVILVSYAIYAFIFASDTQLGEYVEETVASVRNTTMRATNQITSGTGEFIANLRSSLFNEMNTGGQNRRTNLLL